MEKRIDLTQDALRKQIREHEEKYHKPTTVDVETILHAATGIGLVAELKRCYEQMDWLHQVADLATDYIGEIHHSHWDIFEERMFTAGLWERPSE